jgi:hypothetical protein
MESRIFTFNITISLSSKQAKAFYKMWRKAVARVKRFHIRSLQKKIKTPHFHGIALLIT